MEITKNIPLKLEAKFLMELYIQLQESGYTEIYFDWINNHSVDVNAIALYLSLKQVFGFKGITLKHINHTENQSYLRIEKVINCSIADNDCKDIYITPVRSEEEVEMLKIYLSRFFHLCLPIQNLDTRPLEILFFELFMNICQHSFDDNGFVFVSYGENRLMQFVFSDLGIGIAQKIKAFFTNKDFPTDAHAIEYAMQDLVSTQTTTHNKGRGLNTLYSNIVAYKAELEIICNGGRVIISDNRTIADNLAYFYQGTLISITFDMSYLKAKEQVNFEEEIDF